MWCSQDLDDCFVRSTKGPSVKLRDRNGNPFFECEDEQQLTNTLLHEVDHELRLSSPQCSAYRTALDCFRDCRREFERSAVRCCTLCTLQAASQCPKRNFCVRRRVPFNPAH